MMSFTNKAASLVVVALAVALALLALNFSGARPAHAATITINITAQVATVDDPSNLLAGAINVGDTITGTYRYDSTTLDSNAAPTVGDYRHSSPPYGITVNAGGFVFETDPSNVDFLVEIVNDHGTPPSDNYVLRSFNNLPLSNGALVDHIAWQLDDDTATALSSDTLPTVPPTLADWQSIFGLSINGSAPGDPDFEYFIRAHITSADVVLELDADGDGVADASDNCSGTAAGATVDANGCSKAQVDSDGDGVCNAGTTSSLCTGSDQCPGTAAGAAVNANGCSTAQLAAQAGPTPTPTAVLSAQQLPVTGGTPSDGGSSALPALLAIAGALAVMSAGGLWLAHQRRRVR